MTEATFNIKKFNRNSGSLTSNATKISSFVTKVNFQSKDELKLQLKPNAIPAVSGLYAFWWTGVINIINKKLQNSKYKLKGKNSESELIKVEFSNDWIGAAIFKKVGLCLYIGKTTNLRKRISNHLKLGSKDIWHSEKLISGKQPNTSS